MRLEDFTRRIDQLIQQADAVIGTTFSTRAGQRFVDPGAMAGLRAASLSFLTNMFGEKHPFVTTFIASADTTFASNATSARAILVAAKSEMEDGWSASVRGLAAEELFSDFMGMAEYLLAEGYKDAAAVMIGSILEEHLRQLCRKTGLPVESDKGGTVRPMKAELLNASLANATVYNKLDQKAVTTWMDLRNKAAHGKYDEYTRPQVELMYQGVADFLARNSL